MTDRYDAVYITAQSVRPATPRVGLRVTAADRPLHEILGGSTPDQASGVWPEPVWRVEGLQGAKRCEGDAVAQHRVTFSAGTITAPEPTWRWFGAKGEQIERIALATLSLTPAELRAAVDVRMPPDAWIAHPPDTDSLRHLSENIQSGIDRALTRKAEREDAAAGGEVMYGGGCVVLWEHTHRGWIAAELVTNAAMRAILLGDQIDESERAERMAPWRALIGEEAAVAAQALAIPSRHRDADNRG